MCRKTVWNQIETRFDRNKTKQVGKTVILIVVICILFGQRVYKLKRNHKSNACLFVSLITVVCWFSLLFMKTNT